MLVFFTNNNGQPIELVKNGIVYNLENRNKLINLYTGLSLSTTVTNGQINQFNSNTTNAVEDGESGRPGILPASALSYLSQLILYQGNDNYNNILLQRIGKLQNKQLIQSLSVSKLARFEPDRLGGSVTDARRQFRTNARRP